MQLWVATGNQGKLREFKAILEKTAIELHSQNELSYYSSPAETGESFLDNARIKAKSLSSVKPGEWVFAEDSGLIVEGLGGLPGIHSARYAGPHARDSENRAKLLKMMKIRSAQNRAAEFKAVIVLLSPTKEEFVFEGSLKGSVATRETGTGGFGYDPVFLPEGFTQTMAELSAEEKNKISHRFQAAKKMLAHLQEQK